MTSLWSKRGDYLLAVLLVAGFGFAGWKVAHRQLAESFALASQPGPDSKISRADSLPVKTLSAEVSPAGQFRGVATFVSARPGQAVHAASLVELRDGSLRAVWFSGSREGAGDVTIQSAVLPAVGGQWGPENTVFDRSTVQHALMRYVKKIGNPVIARLPDGSLGLWMVNVSLGGWAGSAITWSRSVDEGASWSEPRRLVTSPFLNISTLVKSPPVALEGGQTALPVYHEFVTKFAEVLRLDGQGRVFDKTRIPGSHTSLQPVLLVQHPQLADIYMRSAGSPFVTTSRTTDAGKTWSSTAATPWPNPDSAVAGVVTREGETWLAMNPAATGRETLSLTRVRNEKRTATAAPWIVEGGGALRLSSLARLDYAAQLGEILTASGASEVQVKAYVDSASRQLCSGEQCAQEFSYPYLLQSRDGYIHLVYTWNRSRIKHLRFDPRQALPAAKTEMPDVAVGK